MVSTYYIELAILGLRIILILLAIIICVDIIIKSAGKLKSAILFFIIAFIPSTLYIIGEFLNIDTYFRAGNFLELGLHTLTILFILIGLILLNKLVKNILYEFLKKKNEISWCKDAIIKGYSEEEIKKILASYQLSENKINEILSIYKKLLKENKSEKNKIPTLTF